MGLLLHPLPIYCDILTGDEECPHHDPVHQSVQPEPILPSFVVITSFKWDLMAEIQLAQQSAFSIHMHLQWALRRQNILTDLRNCPLAHFRVGQLLWLSMLSLTLRLPFQKLSPQLIEPFKILKQINPVAYWLQFPPSYRISPTFHVSLLKPEHTLPSDNTTSAEFPYWISKRTWYARSLIPDAMGASCSILWIGRDTAPLSDPG